MHWYDLTVSNISQETKDSVSVCFSIADNLKDLFHWKAGQHIRLQFEVAGESYTRNYSVSSDKPNKLRITVKKVKKGRVSTYINEGLSVGELVKATQPNGNFVLEPEQSKRRSHYFFAAGSGITPIYAMITSVLEKEANSFAYLLYGNKDGASTIFADELNQLEKKYSDRLVVQHCHSSPSWFKSSPWRTGRIDDKAVQAFISENPPYAQDCQYYICGPDSFIPNVKSALKGIDVPNNRIHSEYFGLGKPTELEGGVDADLQVLLNGEQHKLKVNAGESLLQAMLEAGINAPHSCEAGLCGTCQCVLEDGEVNMPNNSALEESEVKSGKILACQAVPHSPKLKVTF
ncbi:ketosteroid-9-alpha-hydroxylase [Parashewanella curva]|uniref:Ketosteroid-9-alpha-hydroxylase n=1 Tax=Parashewanella curva TaxID=2338552 RepID=A0A3L8PXJ7_9GAMM|nr:2Fe-2S iron-sulfur cluster-binding protein [Parashewanella curva]RLV59353.1 ketosteroid-9-alpha-hydroxylase [Parashewanella curva]